MLPFLVPVLVITVILLIRAEFADQHRNIYWLKPLATLLVIAVAAQALFQPGQNVSYTRFIVAGLIFSLGGDLALMFPKNKKLFSLGLGLFLTAHILYATIFVRMGEFSLWSWSTLVVMSIVGLGFYRLIGQNLGSMRGPVIAYITIITMMLVGASMLVGNPTFSGVQVTMIIAGAGLFYVSDIILAANRYWKEWRYNRISLAFYYSGQLLIALSTNYLFQGG